MDLNELQSVQSRERQTDSLQQLRATFYQDAADFIQSLEAERDAAAERADDPWNAPEVGRLNDDIDTAEGTVEAIYERRVGKIVKMASLAAADMPTDDEGLTEEEQALFDQLVAAIEQNREGVFAILDGEEPAIDPTDAGVPTASVPGTSNSDAAESPPAEADSATPPSDTEPPATTADDDHREVPPDVGPPDEAAPDPDPDGGQPSEPGVGAADLMGNGESGGSGEETIGDPGPADAAPVESDPNASDARSPEPAREGEHSEDPTAEQPVRDGGAVDSGSTDSAPGGGDGPRPESTSAGPEPAVPDAGPASSTDASGPGRESADTPGTSSGGESAGDATEAGAEVDRAMVRITDDVGPIYGVEGREYDLTTDDVVTLPEANVGPLLKQGAAERMD